MYVCIPRGHACVSTLSWTVYDSASVVGPACLCVPVLAFTFHVCVCVCVYPRPAGEPESDRVENYGRPRTDLGSFAESCLRDNRNTRGIMKTIIAK